MSILTECAADINPRYRSMGSWKAKKATRKPSRETGMQRVAKRTRCLGNTVNQRIYTSSKAYKNPEYAALCDKVDRYLRGKG